MIEIENANGEFVPWEFADASDKIAIEWAILNGEKAIAIPTVPDTIEGVNK
jgi:hypothetical protein